MQICFLNIKACHERSTMSQNQADRPFVALLALPAAVWDKINVSAGDKLMGTQIQGPFCHSNRQWQVHEPAPENQACNDYTTTHRLRPLNPEKLKRLYSTMLKCRMIEEKVGGLSIQGKIIGDRCPAVGQEATEVGAAIDLLSEDCIAISDRDFISGFIQGTPSS